MKLNKIATATLMASVALSPLSPISVAVRADTGDVVAGLIVGGIIGSAVTKDKKKKKKTTASSSSSSSAAREENIAVQEALNYFGYNVGTPDGAIGPKSRAAIAEYQAFLGYPATGELTEQERSILITAHQRAVAGGTVIADAVSASPHGLKGVLLVQRDEMASGAVLAGTTTAPATGSVAEAAAAALPRLVPEGDEAEEPEVVEAAAEEPALPSFMAPSGAGGSLAAECDSVALASAGNGGIATADTMQDANFALAEQFCLARGSAITTTDTLTAQIAGFSPEQIAEQCAAFGPVLNAHVAALSLKPAAEVLTEVEGFVLTSGMSPAQLSGTAKVCLGTGYAQDNMDVAIGSALILTAMGERAYSEYLGHHLSQGFGATVRPDLAMDWYQMSIDAMDQGQMVVAPEVEGRDTLILKASYTINGRASELEPEAVVEEAALPVIELAPEVVELAPEVVEEVAVVTEAAAATDGALDLDALAEEVAVYETEEAVTEEAATEAVVTEETVPEEAVTEVAEAQPEAVADAAVVSPDSGVSAQLTSMAIRLPLMILTAY